MSNTITSTAALSTSTTTKPKKRQNHRVHRSRDPVFENGWRHRRGPVTRTVLAMSPRARAQSRSDGARTRNRNQL